MYINKLNLTDLKNRLKNIDPYFTEKIISEILNKWIKNLKLKDFILRKKKKILLKIIKEKWTISTK